MYGYIVPEKSKMSQSDFVLYRSFYCGMCCQTGKLYGSLPRFTTNYDFAFLAALLYDYSSADVLIEEHGCVLNPKKKAILQPSRLLERLAATNIILCYQKAVDGVLDGDGLKYKILRRMLKKPYGAAVAVCPQADAAVKRSYERQRQTEKNNVSSLDRAADPFASLMAELPEHILGVKTDDNLKGLCYNIGKFVYLADALDDLDEDAKNKRYNPFIAAFGGYVSRKSFVENNKAGIEQSMFSVCARAAQYFSGMRFTQSYALLYNVVCVGMPEKAKELIGAKGKLKPPRI